MPASPARAAPIVMAGRERLVAGIVRTADLGATFLFAAQGALAGAAVGLDPIGLLVLAFLTGLGGGVIRDLLIADGRPVAVADWHYSVVVVVAAAAAWLLQSSGGIGSAPIVVALDAAALSLAAVAGTEKALAHQVHPWAAIFLGTVGGVGGGLMRDIVLNEIPRLLQREIYAAAAMLAAVIVAAGRSTRLDPRIVAIAGGLACFGLRMLAVHFGWNLPTTIRRG